MEIRKAYSQALRAFVANGVLGEDWSPVSYAVTRYALRGEIRYYRTRNADGKHAEDAVLQHVQSLLAQKILDPPNIRIYTSNSPCRKCSQKLIEFVRTARQKNNINLTVEVVFSSFYKIKRPSNEQNPKYSGRLPSDPEHRYQVEGLKKLYQTPGVRLRTFNEADWQDLLKALGRRKDEDDSLRNDFEQLIGPLFTESEEDWDDDTWEEDLGPANEEAVQIPLTPTVGTGATDDSFTSVHTCSDTGAGSTTTERPTELGDDEIGAVSLEKKILAMEIKLMELKLQAAKKQQETKPLLDKAEYCKLKHLKLYYEIRKLERELGVPGERGVNSLVSSSQIPSASVVA